MSTVITASDWLIALDNNLLLSERGFLPPGIILALWNYSSHWKDCLYLNSDLFVLILIYYSYYFEICGGKKAFTGVSRPLSREDMGVSLSERDRTVQKKKLSLALSMCVYLKMWWILPCRLHQQTMARSFWETVKTRCALMARSYCVRHQQQPLCSSKTCKRNNRHSSREVMKLYQPIKVEILWNEAVHEHVEKSRGCQGKLMFDETGEKKVGLCWRERLKCSDCQYVSAMHKLYTEVSRPGKRGQKSAAPNLGVQVGLSHSSTGNSGLRNVLNAANIPSPAKSGMQRNTNRVAAHLVKVNQDDMSEICRDIGKINEAKGLPTDAAIRMEADARYYNPLYSGSGHTPFQPASQAVYTLCENTTPKKKIISISTINKLCQKCALN